jgi:hypothetical protein
MHDIQFWKELCPNLTITEVDRWATPPEIAIEDARDKIVNDGYFHIPFDSWDLPFDEMTRCIQKLKSLDMQPVWCFIYDEFWLLTVKIDAHIKSILGENYHRLPEIWAWHIDPSKEERGWKIHREGGYYSVFDDGLPKTLTIWIPLTDATSENGCMCVVPIANDPNFYSTDESYYANWQEDFYDDSKKILEAKSGDVLGWHPQILHWGKKSTNKNANPRISMSTEFVSNRILELNDTACFYDKEEYPWLDPFYIPDLTKKTELINKLVSRYQHMWEK